MDTSQASVQQAAPKFLNKIGTLAFGLIVIGSFLPIITIKIFGSAQSTTGIDYYGFSVVLLMAAGAAACFTGLPKLLAKGLAVLTLAYLYYQLYSAVKELYELVNMFGSSRGVGSAIEAAISTLSYGAVVLLLGFILLNLFIFVSYKIHPRFENLEILLSHYSNKGAELAKEKAEQAKQVAEEKAEQAKKAAEEKVESIKNSAENKDK